MGMYTEPPGLSAFDEEVWDYLQWMKECSLLLALAIDEIENERDKEGEVGKGDDEEKSKD